MTSPGQDPYPQYPRYPPYPEPPVPRGRAVPVVVLTLLAALVGGYLLAGYLTRSMWLTGPPRDGVRATLAAKSLDGSNPSPPALTQTRDIVAERLSGAGLADADVAATDTGLTVRVAGTPELVRAVTQHGQLFVRPVIHGMAASTAAPSGPAPAPPATPDPPAPPKDLADRIGFEKQLRQSTNQNIQILALQYQAGRCGEQDILTGNDDPSLPLVTCSQDGQSVYLLDKSIISGEEIANATSGFDQEGSRYLVNLEFNGDAAKTWATFTAANIGTQTAFTLDTRVVSAPAIGEAIPGGRTQIAGPFTAEDARALAATLNGKSLPLTLTIASSEPETLPGQPGSSTVRAILIGSGALVLALAAAAIPYLVRRRRPPAAFLPEG